jgi:hypothetical protein
VAFGVAISEDRKHASVVAAGREQGGTRLLIDLVWYDHPRAAVARLELLSRKHDPVDVALDPRSQAATLITSLADVGIVVSELSAQNVAVSHGDLLDLLGDGGLIHLNQPPMTAAVRAAQQRRLSGAQAWKRDVSVDQSPLEAATFASWSLRRWEKVSAPGVHQV